MAISIGCLLWLSKMNLFLTHQILSIATTKVHAHVEP
ncbi:hypothetical protein GLYMA_18G129933v4 [Glycine max]|nr:hypothetical protein GLYMA_18G129933v4 [Glycine max]KAH1154325.1 hypothetical protein GYH30_049836 [Glycine max]